MKISTQIIVCFFTYFFCEVCQAYTEKLINNEKVELTSIQIVSEIYPPYQFVDKSGEARGWSADKVRAIFKQANINYHIDFYPWTRAYSLAQTQPEIFIFSLLKTKLREPLFHWVVPLCEIDFSFYRLKKRADIKLSSLEDAKQYLIATQQGQASSEYLLTLGFEPGKNLTISYRNSNFIQGLIHGRVDLIVLSSAYVASLRANKSPYIDQIEAILPIDYLRNSTYLASSLDTSPALIAALRKAYDEITTQFAPACNDE